MNNNINKSDLPIEENYRTEIRQAIKETRTAIRDALGYIRRQEDGPVTMRHALRTIEQTVTAIESEVIYLTGSLELLQAVTLELLEQRDEAIRQRDLLMK